MRITRFWGAVMAAALLAGLPTVGHAQQGAVTYSTTAATGNTSVALPFGASEVVKMYKGGISKDVILGYVESSVGPFRLTADEIISLQGQGIPQDVVTAMLHRDGELQRDARNSAAWQQQTAAAAQAAPPMGTPPNGYVATPSTPAPAVNYATPPAVYPDYSDYDSGYPYYGGTVVVGSPYWGWPYYGYGWRGGWYGGGWRGGWRGGGGWHGGGGFHGGPVGGGHGGGIGGGHGGGGGGGHR